MNDSKETIPLSRRMFYAAVPVASVTLNLCIAAWAMNADPDVGSWPVWRVLLLAVPFVAMVNALFGPWTREQSYVLHVLMGFMATTLLWGVLAIVNAFLSLWYWALYLPSHDSVFFVAAAAIIFTIASDLMARALVSGSGGGLC